MGMIVTLYLISANVYNSVDAPKNRGFSYIEIWMFGTQFPILVALLEYGFVLLLKKVAKLSDKNKKKIFEENIKMLDLATMIFSFCSFLMFASIYWIVALTSAWFIQWSYNYLHMSSNPNKLEINVDWLPIYTQNYLGSKWLVVESLN